MLKRLPAALHVVAPWLAGLFLVAGALLLFLPLPWSPSGRLALCLWDGLHLPFVAAGMLAISFLARRALGVRLRPWQLAAAGSVLTVLAEILQPLAGRSESARDAFFGICGSGVAAALSAAARAPSAKRRCGAIALAAVFVLVAAIPPGLIVADRAAARRAFPRLASFETRLELVRWKFRDCSGRRVAHHATDGSHALEVSVTRTADFPMLTLGDGLGDWAGTRALALDAWVPGNQALDLHCRVDLPAATTPPTHRCQTSVRLAPGWNHVTLPFAPWLEPCAPSAPLRPRRLVLYLQRGTAGDTFVLDNLRLLP